MHRSLLTEGLYLGTEKIQRTAIVSVSTVLTGTAFGGIGDYPLCATRQRNIWSRCARRDCSLYALSDPNASVLCENPARYHVGTAETYVEERPTNDPETPTLETEERERNQKALLCCGVHKERAKERWRHREQAPDSSEYPLITDLDR